MKIRNTKIATLMTLSWALAPISAHAQDPTWLPFVKQMVEVNSDTSNLAGLESMRQIVAAKFLSIGFRSRIISVANARKVLILERADVESTAVLLVGHLDTVFKKDSPFQKLTVDGDRVSGPGIVDMKGGIALMFELISSLSAEEQRRVRVVLNDDEEFGSPDSRKLLMELSQGQTAALVLEPGLADGSVVTSQSGVQFWKISVHGKAAHAGLEPEKGWNACVELGHKVADLAALSRYADKLSVNVGVVKGGEKPNIVCEQAEAAIDLRYLLESDLEKTVDAMQAITARTYTSNAFLPDFVPVTTMTKTISMPPLPARSTTEIFELARKAAGGIGQALAGAHVGYGSDANNIAASGIRILVGLGPYGGGMHTENEFMSMKAFGERLRLNQALLRELLKQTEKN